MSARPWLPLYYADYLADTQALDRTGHACYLLMLMYSWGRGPVPDDDRKLASITRGSAADARVVLSEYWTLTDAGWVNRRLEQERVDGEAKYQAKVARIAAARKARLQASNQASNQGLISSPLSAGQPQPQPQPQKNLRDVPTVQVETSPPDEPADAVSTRNNVPYQQILDRYHELLCPPLARVYKLTPGRRQGIQARWREDLTDLEDWESYFRAVASTKLCKGFRRPDGSYWQPDFGWLVKAENFAKVTEGRYG